jgi:hypothetical protein
MRKAAFLVQVAAIIGLAGCGGATPQLPPNPNAAATPAPSLTSLSGLGASGASPSGSPRSYSALGVCELFTEDLVSWQQSASSPATTLVTFNKFASELKAAAAFAAGDKAHQLASALDAASKEVAKAGKEGAAGQSVDTSLLANDFEQIQDVCASN